jgi:transcriptional regulator with XRE-family HTH domain
MVGIGAGLLTIRHQWQHSLLEVEKRTRCLAQEKGNQSYHVSASWLHRLEREDHKLSVSKLMALAEIYNVSPGQLLRCIDPGSGQNLIPRQLSPENASMILGAAQFTLPTEWSQRSRARCFQSLSDTSTSGWGPATGGAG